MCSNLVLAGCYGHSGHFTSKNVLSFILVLHTYIIGYYNSSVRITSWLLIPLMLCALVLYESGGTYRLMSTVNDRFLRNFFMTGLFNLRVFARNLLRGNRRRSIFLFIFRFEIRSNKLAHYLIDYGDFKLVLFNYKFR